MRVLSIATVALLLAGSPLYAQDTAAQSANDPAAASAQMDADQARTTDGDRDGDHGLSGWLGLLGLFGLLGLKRRKTNEIDTPLRGNAAIR